MNPEELRYTQTHEWVHIAADPSGVEIATVGLSAFAVEALTDLVFIELPEVGRQVKAGEPMSEVESVKAVSDIYAPVSGEVIAVNDKLPDELERLGEDPYGEGWIVRIRVSDASNLEQMMNYAAYQKQCSEHDE